MMVGTARSAALAHPYEGEKTVKLLGDVVHLHLQMIGRKHRLRPLHLIDIGHDRENMTGADGLDGDRKRRERADVNHDFPFLKRQLYAFIRAMS
jgi:hypothetical protein